MVSIRKVEALRRLVIWTSLKLGRDLTGLPAGSSFKFPHLHHKPVTDLSLSLNAVYIEPALDIFPIELES